MKIVFVPANVFQELVNKIASQNIITNRQMFYFSPCNAFVISKEEDGEILTMPDDFRSYDYDQPTLKDLHNWIRSQT